MSVVWIAALFPVSGNCCTEPIAVQSYPDSKVYQCPSLLCMCWARLPNNSSSNNFITTSAILQSFAFCQLQMDCRRTKRCRRTDRWRIVILMHRLGFRDCEDAVCPLCTAYRTQKGAHHLPFSCGATSATIDPPLDRLGDIGTPLTTPSPHLPRLWLRQVFAVCMFPGQTFGA